MAHSPGMLAGCSQYMAAGCLRGSHIMLATHNPSRDGPRAHTSTPTDCSPRPPMRPEEPGKALGGHTKRRWLLLPHVAPLPQQCPCASHSKHTDTWFPSTSGSPRSLPGQKWPHRWPQGWTPRTPWVGAPRGHCAIEGTHVPQRTAAHTSSHPGQDAAPSQWLWEKRCWQPAAAARHMDGADSPTQTPMCYPCTTPGMSTAPQAASLS